MEEKSLLRNLIQTATNIVTEGFEQGDDVQTILDAAERNIMEVSERRNKSGFLTISEVLNTAIENIDQLARNDANWLCSVR